MRKRLGFRLWFYLRQGWATYFNFIFAAINTSVVTYYLAIEKIPGLQEIFPSFANYVVVMSVIIIPILVFVGYFHYRRIPAYSSEVDVSVTSNPYVYRSQPGWQIEVIFPLYLMLSKYLIKVTKNESLSDSDLDEITKIQSKIEKLLKGGFIGKNIPRSIVSPEENKD